MTRSLSDMSCDARREAAGSHMPDFVRHLVEGRMAIDLRLGRLEHHARASAGSEAVIAFDGTTQIDRPSPRRV